jgi:aminoglycoside phosphotransferase (APT) family kinase protein
MAASRLPDLRDDAVRHRLTGYLRDNWSPTAEVAALSRADGGFSNETWFLDIAGSSAVEHVVLRRQALIGPLEPYDLEREAAVLTALRIASEVPVPEVFGYCGDRSIMGSPFTLIERLDGEVPDYRSVPQYPPWSEPTSRTKMAESILAALAGIQRAPWREESLSALLDNPDGRTPPVVGRVQAWLDKLDLRLGDSASLPVLRDAGHWLVANAPPLPPDDGVVVHGDFRVGNFIWAGTTVTAVLDWEGASVGDPLEDLGYFCHPMARLRAPSLMGMLVPYDELAAIYEAEFGRALDAKRAHYYLIYALYFHLSSLVAGLASAYDGADFRVGLGYTKFAVTTTSLIDHIRAYEEGTHVL